MSVFRQIKITSKIDAAFQECFQLLNALLEATDETTVVLGRPQNGNSSHGGLMRHLVRNLGSDLHCSLKRTEAAALSEVIRCLVGGPECDSGIGISFGWAFLVLLGLLHGLLHGRLLCAALAFGELSTNGKAHRHPAGCG